MPVDVGSTNGKGRLAVSAATLLRAVAILQALVDRSPVNSAGRCDFCEREGATTGLETHGPRCLWRRTWLLIERHAKEEAYRTAGRQFLRGKPHAF